MFYSVIRVLVLIIIEIRDQVRDQSHKTRVSVFRVRYENLGISEIVLEFEIEIVP